MPSYLIHVRPSNTGAWVVQPEDREAPLSHHTCETDAERAAIEEASTLEDCSVVVHDCYARVRILRPGASSWRKRR